MFPKVLKVVASVVIIGGGLAYLVGASLGDNLQYYKQVDEVEAHLAKWTGPRLKMGGKVVKGSIFNKPGTMQYQFTVARNGKSAVVHFNGVVPDTFKDGAIVVVSGKMTKQGWFDANEVIAKCPSKYQAAKAEGLTHPENIPMTSPGS